MRVYNVLERVEHLRHMAGLLFEAMARLQLQDVALNLVPMIKQQTTSGKTIAQWISHTGDTSTVPGSIGQGPDSAGAGVANVPISTRLKPASMKGSNAI